jgi:DnaK suppressor protein
MTHSRHAELKAMLEARRDAMQEQVLQKMRAFRDTAGATTRPPADLSDDPEQENLDFALVEMHAQTLEHITSALDRLRAGEYGLCHQCEEEIPEKRLRALPFATRCLSCQESAEQRRSSEQRTHQRQTALRRRPAIDTLGS